MKIKTTELQGAVLDWAVAKCEGLVNEDGLDVGFIRDGVFTPSIDWAQGGPIIEREWLDITPWPNESDEDLRWQCKQHDSIDCVAFGPTPLVAAMRCYVASVLGAEVEVPDEIL
jgi:hypothetical protein